ncbi:hypothetical protein FRB95_002722 [Tulasnella sp. JGI-2019a]|nr:hypothetical protein FRB95_002722 [Tulasnella sp. JGI-2019a]
MPATRTSTAEPEEREDKPHRGGKAMTERTRNAQAQARHREKRKAYIDNLENSVLSLKTQLAAMTSAPRTAGEGGEDGDAVDARVRALTEENERLKSEINTLKEKLYSGNLSSGVSSALSSPGGLEDDRHTLPSLGTSTSPVVTSSAVPLSLDIPRAMNSYTGAHTDQQSGNKDSQHQISPSRVSSNFAGRQLDTGPLNAPHMVQQRHSLPSLLPSLVPAINWGSRGPPASADASSSIPPSAQQPASSINYTGGWDPSKQGPSSASSQWDTGSSYAQLQQGLTVSSQSGSTYLPHDPRPSSIDGYQGRQLCGGLGDSIASSSAGQYFPSSEQPRGGAQFQQQRSQYSSYQEHGRYAGGHQQAVHIQSTSMQQGEDAELMDTLSSTYTSANHIDQMAQRTVDYGSQPQSSAPGGWMAHGQKRGHLPEISLVGTSILPGGGLGSVPLPPGSTNEMSSVPTHHPGPYDQRRWSHENFVPGMQWSPTSNSSGVNFHPLGAGAGQQQHQPVTSSSTSSYSSHPLSSVPPFISGSSSNSLSRSRSASRSISSASISDSPRSIPVSPAPGRSLHTSSSFSGASGTAGQSHAAHTHNAGAGGHGPAGSGPVKMESNVDLPMGVPSGLGR